MTCHKSQCSISPEVESATYELFAAGRRVPEGHEGEKEKVSEEASSSTDVPNMNKAEDEETEQAPIIMAKDPGCPTAEEVEIHNLTHLPHRSWCPVCIKARGKEEPHFKSKEDKEGRKPTV